jgi:hypothetical protein
MFAAGKKNGLDRNLGITVFFEEVQCDLIASIFIVIGTNQKGRRSIGRNGLWRITRG